ncbi:hypothetical protein RvY_11562 [Ramazzottius varieornatus]|uniref:Uncharacterized protein n=1 Tax=Ramazzottius varieornatus TaxID=947166 RepID=A0A1D1VGL0_RAMVA|nr:hypothetical protein RvY_11562 [Ramazzottius varieornatus]
MSEDGGIQKEPEKSQQSKKKRFTYNPRHLIALLRQVAADNPFQFASNAARLKRRGRTELKRLLEKVALLRKEEDKRHKENAAIEKARPVQKKSARKSRGVTEALQGKDIREGSILNA